MLYTAKTLLLCAALVTASRDVNDVSRDAPLHLPHVRVAAFNVQVFGATKAERDDVMNVLVQVVLGYDVILIQEIRDKTGTAILDLLARVNEASNVSYSMELSGRLGRTTSKEQYAYLYRPDVLTAREQFQFDDENDEFERPPFGVYFTTDKLEAMSGFGLLGVHTAPDSAETEINALTAVYNQAARRWNSQDIFLLGDFNADCSYVTASEWDLVSLWTEPRFRWLIDTSQDTTTSATDCAYDRIVVAGQAAKSAVVPGSARVQRFDQELGLNEELTRAVSDHYPVEVELGGKVNEAARRSLSASRSFTVEEHSAPSLTLTPHLLHSLTALGFHVYDDVPDVLRAERTDVTDVLGVLADVGGVVPLLQTSVDLAERYLAEGALDPLIVVPGLTYPAPGEPATHTLLLTYDTGHPPSTYRLTVSRAVLLAAD